MTINTPLTGDLDLAVSNTAVQMLQRVALFLTKSYCHADTPVDHLPQDSAVTCSIGYLKYVEALGEFAVSLACPAAHRGVGENWFEEII